MKKLITIILFMIISGGAFSQYSPTFDTLKLYRGGHWYYFMVSADKDTLFMNEDTIPVPIYYYATSGDTVFINGDTIITSVGGSLISPLFGAAVDSSLITTTIKFPLGYSNGIVIDTLIYIATTYAGEWAISVVPKLYYGTDIGETGTAVIISPGTVTSHTAATKVSTFDNATINAGNMIWLTFTTVTTIPRNFMVQITGHRQ